MSSVAGSRAGCTSQLSGRPWAGHSLSGRIWSARSSRRAERPLSHGIQEGYWYSGEEDRAVLTPMWEIETDQGTFLLDCAQGLLTRAT